MERRFAEQELKSFRSFLIETFKFTEEQNDAIDGRILMTQEIYDTILDRCAEIGPEAGPLFYRMLDEYPNMMAVNAARIEKEVEGAGLPSLTPEAMDDMKQKLYDRIRAEYGEDAICVLS